MDFVRWKKEQQHLSYIVARAELVLLKATCHACLDLVVL
jgi:hypothetical protein